MSTLRKLSRSVKRGQNKLPMKKAVARKLGLTNKELNQKFFNESKEDKENGGK